MNGREVGIDRVKTELAQQRMVGNLIPKDIYDRDIDEIKKQRSEALRKRDEETAKEQEILQVTTKPKCSTNIM